VGKQGCQRVLNTAVAGWLEEPACCNSKRCIFPQSGVVQGVPLSCRPPCAVSCLT